MKISFNKKILRTTHILMILGESIPNTTHLYENNKSVALLFVMKMYITKRTMTFIHLHIVLGRIAKIHLDSFPGDEANVLTLHRQSYVPFRSLPMFWVPRENRWRMGGVNKVKG